jgi:uncharacterized membrane protein YqaE (UPF0057 family)
MQFLQSLGITFSIMLFLGLCVVATYATYLLAIGGFVVGVCYAIYKILKTLDCINQA